MRVLLRLHDLPLLHHEGFRRLPPAEDAEEDLLDEAWALQNNSRLTCQTKVGSEDITVEIPKYSRNHARENG